MKQHVKLSIVALLALGLTSGFGLAAAAQDVDDTGEVVEERYVVEESAAPVVYFDEDDDDDADASSDAMQRCAETFRSFDASTGTYVTYDGETRICPYLD